MSGDGLEFVGPAPGRWLQEWLKALGGKVGDVVPASFPAYSRVLHRIDPDGEVIRWSDVCAETGAVPHPLMQWGAISQGWSGDENEATARSNHDPGLGNLDEMSMAALYEVLGADAPAFHAFWIGWGDFHPAWRYAVGDDGGYLEKWDTETTAPFPRSTVDGPVLELPSREYLVFFGALDPQLFARDPFRSQSPNLTWPGDHSWCVATEVDFDSTLIGGSVELIAAVLAHPGLEAWPVEAEDSLAYDADRINTV